MEDDIVEESASKEEQLESSFSEMKDGDCFVAFDDEEPCVDEWPDVDDMLQDVIASLRVGSIVLHLFVDLESDDDDIQCQRVTNVEVRKSLSLLRRFMTKHGYTEKSFYAFDQCKRAVDLCSRV